MPQEYIPAHDVPRKLGRLIVFRDKHWRTNVPRLEIHITGRRATAHLEIGALGGTVLAFTREVDNTFRAEIALHRKQLDTLLILGG